jgi:CubicO group peptidase (beta-lactamase class C family)
MEDHSNSWSLCRPDVAKESTLMDPIENLTGRVADGFESVAEAFAATVPNDGLHGAALSVWLEGESIIELQGGTTHEGQAWNETTVAPTYSCTKGIASLAVAMLLERGVLDSYETPLAAIWPEFGAEGKDLVTVGDALAHRGGVSAAREDLTRAEILDGESLAAALARQAPLWEPGASHQYHTFSHGVITAEVVRRLDGRTIGRFMRETISEPLNADFWIGVRPDELARIALTRTPAEEEEWPIDPLPTPPDATYWALRAADFGGVLSVPDFMDDMSIFTAELPGAGGVGSASGLARIWSATVAPTLGVRLLSDETVAALASPRSGGRQYFGGPAPYQAWGAGVMIPSVWEPYLTPHSLGHDGAGGQVAFADPDHKLGFGYVTTRMGNWERGQSIIEALRSALK